MTEVSITPLSSALGAEVRGIDLAAPLPPDVVAELVEAWQRHIVLVFREQSLSEEAQLSFAGRFGVVSKRSRPPERRPEGASYNPAIRLVSNIRENGVPIGSLPDGEMWFHHDGCHSARPYHATFLYAIQIPSRGGDTRFANMYAAYDNLSDEMKSWVSGRKALQVYDYTLAERVDANRDIGKYSHFSHPVAVSHPVTGRKALYVNPLMTTRIEGIARSESDKILAELFKFTERGENIYQHVWKPGDLVMWDNWSSCHARTDFPPTEPRLLRRCTIAGRALTE